jgi:glycosyltransferase involved in cell wall biosynthesis
MSGARALTVMDVPPRLEYPSGFAGRSYHFAKALTERWPLDALAIHNGEVDWVPDSFLAPGLVIRRYWCERSRANPLNRPGLVGRVRRAKHYLFDELPYWSYPARLPVLQELVRQQSPQLVVFFSRASAHLSLQLPTRVPTVLVLDERWGRSWPSSGGAWYRLKTEWITRTERARTERLLRRLGDHGDWVVAISSTEQKWFSGFFPDERIWVLPHGVDCEFFAPIESKEDIDVAVIGDLSQSRNFEPAVELLDWMESCTSSPFARLRWAFVGRAPHDSVLARRSSRVMVTGLVPDVRPYYGRSKVILVPSRIGAGSKTTLLQAWAMGRAVVATPFSLTGLPARSGENVLAGKSCEELAGGIAALLQSPDLRRRIGRAGLATAREECNVQHIASRFAELCSRTMSENDSMADRH